MIDFIATYFWHIVALAGLGILWAGIGSLHNCYLELLRIRLLIEGEALSAIEEQASKN